MKGKVWNSGSDKDQMMTSLFEKVQGDKESITNNQLLQVQMIKKDAYQKDIVKMAMDKGQTKGVR